MRLVRPALAAALVASLAAGGFASAATKPAPKPVCNLVTDDAGDASALGVGDPSSNALDILSADVATSAKTLKAVIRVKDIKADNFTQQGKEFKFIFSVAGSFYYLRVQSTPGLGDSYDYGTLPTQDGTSTSVGAAEGSYDTATNSVIFTIDKSLLGVKSGTKIGDFLARSYISLGAQFIGWDDATASTTYVDQTKSCVSVS